MTQNELMKVADDYGINREIFSEFISRRFGNESELTYIDEWAQRFTTGTPEMFMDTISKAIYRDIIDGKV
jgi:hypothetical protein